RHVRGHRRDVGVLNVVLCAGQVLDLRILDVRIRRQLVDAGADGAALRGHVGDSGGDVFQRCFRFRRGAQVLRGIGSGNAQRYGGKHSNGRCSVGIAGDRTISSEGGRGGAEDSRAVEGSRCADVGDFTQNRREFGAQSGRLRGGEPTVGRFRGDGDGLV